MGQPGSIHQFSAEAVTRRLQAARMSFRTPEIAASVRGPLLTLATAIAFDVLARYGLIIQTPFPVMILTVLYSALVGGFGPASISALITTVYAFHFFSERVGFLLYDVPGVANLVSTLGAAWLTAVVVSRVARTMPPPAARELTHEEGSAIRRRLSLVESASTLLASSLDYECTVGRLARLLVPTLGDWCTIHLAGESGELRFIAAAHRDVGREMMVRMLAECGGRAPFGVPTGSADILAVDLRSLGELTKDAGQLELHRALCSRVAIRVPIVVRDEMAGVLTLVLAESGREASPEDVELAQELAGRISLAIANAMLHREATQAARRFDALFAAHPQPMWVFDTETLQFLSVNAAAVRHYGYSADEFAAMSIMDLVPEQDASLPLAPVERMDSRGGVALTRHQRKDGTIVETELTSQEVELDGRRGRLVVATDVSERTRVVASLHQVEEQLRDAQRMDALGRIGIGVAHDFNNVLTTIRGFGDLLARDLPADDRRRSGVERIIQAADRGTLLSRQLLAIGDRQPLQPRPVGVNSLVRGMEGLIRRLAGDDIVVRTRLADGLGAVQIDPGRLEQAVVSLILTAREAMPSGGTMTIETSERTMGGFPTGRQLSPGSYAVLAIGDSGSGLETEPLPRPLDRRAGEELGLRVVNGIARQSGGMVRVSSEPGAGRTVKIYLPLLDAAGPPSMTGLTPNGTETVLVAEDEDAIRELVKRRLSDAGYRVLEARDGNEALQVSGSHQGPIHLLVTDVVMPGMNGGDLAQALAGSRPGLEAMYMSGYSDNEILRRGVRRDDDRFLNKPFSGDDLLRKARALLDSRSA